MTGFLFGLALGLFVGTIVGIFTVALMQAGREREVDAIFARYREDMPIDLWPVDVTAARRIDVPLPRIDVLPEVNVRPEDVPPSGGLPWRKP